MHKNITVHIITTITLNKLDKKIFLTDEIHLSSLIALLKQQINRKKALFIAKNLLLFYSTE